MASTPEIANEGSIPGVALGGRQPSGSSTAGRAFGVYFMAAAPTLDRARATKSPLSTPKCATPDRRVAGAERAAGGERDRQVSRHEAGRE